MPRFEDSFILLYYALTVVRPGLYWVAVVNAFEQFAWGLGVSAYTVFLMRTVKKEYKATHYAIATSLMAVGVMVPGAVSGFLQEALGYGPFFLLSAALAVPGILLLFVVPYREAEG